MKVIILGKENCSSCVSAKQLCEQKQVEYEYKTLGKDYDITQFYDFVPKTHRTFPAILCVENGVESYIGGLHQLQQILGGS